MWQNERKKLFCSSVSRSSDSVSLCAGMETGDGDFMLAFKQLDCEQNSLALSLLVVILVAAAAAVAV